MKVGLHDLARSHISSHVEKVILSDSLWTRLSDPNQGGRLSAVLGIFITSLPPVGPPGKAPADVAPGAGRSVGLDRNTLSFLGIVVLCLCTAIPVSFPAGRRMKSSQGFSGFK